MSSSNSLDSVGTLPTSSSSTRPTHRQSSTASIDFSDESRDTVELTDSEDWLPRFKYQPAPVKKIEQGVSTGLSNLLANRMAKSDFETRFLGGADIASLTPSTAAISSSIQAKEASGESLFIRSTKLGALLANRPDKARLESLNIMKAPQGATASSSFAGLQAKLEASKKKDRLNSLISARPDQGALIKRGLLLDQSQATSSEPVGNKLASAKNALGDFFASRPDPSQLVKQKIITDVGALPGGFEHKQENQLVPQRVAELDGKKIVNVSLGFSHTLALDSTGTVYVFGSGANGRLGLTAGSLSDVTKPTALPRSHFNDESVKVIDAGENHSAAITESGKLYTWGTGAWGRLGLGNQDDQTVPAQVTLPEGELAQAVSAGAYHTLMLTQTNKLYAFGWGKNGRLGLGRKHPSLLVLEPTLIPFFTSSDLSPIQSFEAGAGYSYVLLQNGAAYLWGSGSFGGLGFGDEQDVWEPKQLGVEQYLRLAIGSTHSLAVGSNGLYSFGANDKGQLGRQTHEEKHAEESASSSSTSPTASPSPHSSAYSPGFVRSEVSISLAAGKSHSLCVDSNGSTYGWGHGSRGTLGIGSEIDQHTPTMIAALTGERVTQVDAAWTHSAAITEDGKLFTWGAKNNGRLGY